MIGCSESNIIARENVCHEGSEDAVLAWTCPEQPGALLFFSGDVTTINWISKWRLYCGFSFCSNLPDCKFSSGYFPVICVLEFWKWRWWVLCWIFLTSTFITDDLQAFLPLCFLVCCFPWLVAPLCLSWRSNCTKWALFVVTYLLVPCQCCMRRKSLLKPKSTLTS